MPPASRAVSSIVVGLLVTATLVPACSDSTALPTLASESEDASSGGDADAPAKDSGIPRDGGSRPPREDDAASGDADADADAGRELEPGDPCTEVGEVYERRCGKCGTKSASCSPSHVVTGFGACVEPEDACEPGATENAVACGYCGTTTRTCSSECKWVEQVCQGEVTTPERCKAGEQIDRDQGCAPGVMRPWRCSATCAWTDPTVTCEEASRILVVGGAAGAKVSRTLKLRDEKIIRLVDAAQAPCKLSAPPFSTTTHYAYVELRNPNVEAAKVDIAVGKTAPAQASLSLLVAGYATLPDATPDQRKQCLTGSPFRTVTDAELTFLTGNRAITIPATGSAWIYVGNFSADDPAAQFVLSATVSQLPAQ